MIFCDTKLTGCVENRNTLLAVPFRKALSRKIESQANKIAHAEERAHANRALWALGALGAVGAPWALSSPPRKVTARRNRKSCLHVCMLMPNGVRTLRPLGPLTAAECDHTEKVLRTSSLYHLIWNSLFEINIGQGRFDSTVLGHSSDVIICS